MNHKFAPTIVRTTVSSILLTAVTGIVTAQHGGGHSDGMGGIGGGMGDFGWWPPLWSLILLGVLLIMGYGIHSHRRTPATEQIHTDTALSTLRSQYARGDLSEEEFKERRRRLEE